jgi:hypothetical protein
MGDWIVNSQLGLEVTFRSCEDSQIASTFMNFGAKNFIVNNDQKKDFHVWTL